MCVLGMVLVRVAGLLLLGLCSFVWYCVSLSRAVSALSAVANVVPVLRRIERGAHVGAFRLHLL